jgi:hypothetical protein
MFTTRWCHLLLLYAILGIAVPSLAQDKAFIEGDADKVVNGQGVPVPGVVLKLQNTKLQNESQGVLRTDTSDSDGMYRFFDLTPSDDYVISATADPPWECWFPGIDSTQKYAAQKFSVSVGEKKYILPPLICEQSAAAAPASPKTPPASGGPADPTASADGSPQQTAPQSGGPPSPPPATAKQQVGESSPIVLDLLSTSMSTVISSEQLRTLPLYNRNFLVLGFLSIGAHDVQAGSTLAGASFSISGQQPTTNDFLIDGMNNVAAGNNQAIPFQVNDAIQEFRVVYANPDAQFGREMGGVVNIVTQRGTSNFHGSIFGFFNSDSLNANSPISVYANSGFAQAAAYAGALNSAPAPAYVPFGQPIYEPATYNQYVATVKNLNAENGTQYCTTPGAAFGSPQCNQLFDPAALLASHNSFNQPFSSQQFGGRAGGSFLKKWFWFGDYEGTRINNPNPIFERVPSAYDRSHLDEFAAGTSGYQDALIASKVLASYPQSNVVAVPDVLEFYQGQAPNYTNVDNYMARLDFNQSDKSNWSFRYNLQDLHQLHDDTLPSSAVYPGNGSNTSALNQNVTLTFLHEFSPNMTNEARVAFTRFQVLETPQDQNFNAANVGLSSGPLPTFLLSGLDPQYAGATKGNPGAFGGWYDSYWSSIPALASSYTEITPSLDGLFPFARIGAPLGSPSQRRDSQGQYVDNLSLTKGRHYLRMGGEFRNLQDIFIADGFTRGMVVSSDIGEFTSDSATCNPPTGAVTSYCSQLAFSNPSFDYALRQPAPYRGLFNSYVVAGYIQDTWRARRHLTVNLGLRYEYFSVPSETNNQIWNYDPAANGLVQQNHTQVFDPFSFNCAANGYSQLDSVFPANAALLPWRCQPNASYNLNSSKANFGPRVGLAWSNAGATTVIRGGYGIFYDQLPVSGIAQLMFNRPTPSNFTNPGAIYGQSFVSPYCGSLGQCGMGNTSLVSIDPNAATSQVATVPFGISAINARQFQSPRSQQVNLSIEQQLGQKVSLEAAYVGNFTSRIPAITNAGFNNEWFCTNSAGAPIPGEPNGTTNCDSFSYLPIQTLSDAAHGNYNAMVLQAHTKGWRGLSANAAYSWSKALDNASQVNFSLIPTSLFTQIYALQFYGLGNPSVFGIGNNQRFKVPGINPPSPSAFPPSLNTLLNAGLTTTGQGQVYTTPYNVPQDPTNYLNNDYATSDLNLTNRLVVDFAWNLPWRQSSKLLGGWTVSGIFIAESGQPFTIFTGPIAGELTQRVNLTGLPTTTGNPNAYIGQTNSISMPSLTCAAALPAQSYYVQGQTLFNGTAGTPCPGNSARNQFGGPAYVDFDTAVQKNIPISERLNLVLRAEFYNLFNRSNYYNPITAYSLNGVTTNPQFGEIKSAHDPRRIQLAVRLNW